ncbi:MAG: hypothetical protein IJ640_02695 [Prevotella sp.]|nr:hypothetical protein [Prevotella sp.]
MPAPAENRKEENHEHLSYKRENKLSQSFENPCRSIEKIRGNHTDGALSDDKLVIHTSRVEPICHHEIANTVENQSGDDTNFYQQENPSIYSVGKRTGNQGTTSAAPQFVYEFPRKIRRIKTPHKTRFS